MVDVDVEVSEYAESEGDDQGRLNGEGEVGMDETRDAASYASKDYRDDNDDDDDDDDDDEYIDDDMEAEIDRSAEQMRKKAKDGRCVNAEEEESNNYGDEEYQGDSVSDGDEAAEDEMESIPEC